MSSDYKDLFAEFNAHGVEFLVVGAHALTAITGVEFDEAWACRLASELEGEPLLCFRGSCSSATRLPLEEYKTWPQDLADVEWLQENPPEN